MMKFIVFLLVLFINLNAGDQMKVVFKVGDESVSATLNDSSAARQFYDMLPLEVKLENYGSNEKIFSLPNMLSTANTHPNLKVSVGDISYYAPWGNIAIFHKPSRGDSQLYTIGRFDGDFSAVVNGSITKIERAK
ncbi:hypothetical protein KDE13_07175 [Campylobacter sp. faydin G-140]|uniref:cyclophilin-like fold protein n=1 Tax=Campylobacter anatolicus TaxID=2829105 RepID=UPI001BA14750|nr:cyclophilin-like fold protein [Campylobacter anatolicus]MBR8466118.1 hypothetical protein [Campylobacter anatolicus]